VNGQYARHRSYIIVVLCTLIQDLIKCLARVNKVLMKFSHIDHVPMTLTVTKRCLRLNLFTMFSQCIHRLAQCLNPVLPGGVHLKTLETYRVILERIGPQRLVQVLSHNLCWQQFYSDFAAGSIVVFYWSVSLTLVCVYPREARLVGNL